MSRELYWYLPVAGSYDHRLMTSEEAYENRLLELELTTQYRLEKRKQLAAKYVAQLSIADAYIKATEVLPHHLENTPEWGPVGQDVIVRRHLEMVDQLQKKGTT